MRASYNSPDTTLSTTVNANSQNTGVNAQLENTMKIGNNAAILDTNANIGMSSSGQATNSVQMKVTTPQKIGLDISTENRKNRGPSYATASSIRHQILCEGHKDSVFAHDSTSSLNDRERGELIDR